MANRRDIKRRIVSVINTQKITKAMKLVAAAKFARASHAVNSARPYSKAFDQMVAKLVESGGDRLSSSLMVGDPTKPSLLVVIATDRGLCGGLNTNLFRATRLWLNEQSKAKSFVLMPWGRKAISWAKKQKESVLSGKEKLLDKPSYANTKQLVDELLSIFKSGEYGAIYLAYSQFVNALTQKSMIIPFLPVDASSSSATEGSEHSAASVGSGALIVEPSLDEMLTTLLSRKLSVMLFQALLDGAASEFGSRMTAMDSATNNAAEVRKKLALQYNRARQAAITKELIEIISGAEAL
jgi:F-type H+-transporting ATPase subunit gamma